METSASSKPGPRHRSTRHVASATRCTEPEAYGRDVRPDLVVVLPRHRPGRQVATDSTTSSIAQNGSRAAQLQTISIDKQGNIVATFGSGQSVKLAQLSMASFNNPKGLFKLGANLYGESGAAGLPNIGTAGSGGKGTLIGSALETSNVDIAEEFTKMILAQRGFQASARTITVSDELLLETLNLKR